MIGRFNKPRSASVCEGASQKKASIGSLQECLPLSHIMRLKARRRIPDPLSGAVDHLANDQADSRRVRRAMEPHAQPTRKASRQNARKLAGANAPRVAVDQLAPAQSPSHNYPQAYASAAQHEGSPLHVHWGAMQDWNASHAVPPPPFPLPGMQSLAECHPLPPGKVDVAALEQAEARLLKDIGQLETGLAQLSPTVTSTKALRHPELRASQAAAPTSLDQETMEWQFDAKLEELQARRMGEQAGKALAEAREATIQRLTSRVKQREGQLSEMAQRLETARRVASEYKSRLDFEQQRRGQTSDRLLYRGPASADKSAGGSPSHVGIGAASHAYDMSARPSAHASSSHHSRSAAAPLPVLPPPSPAPRVVDLVGGEKAIQVDVKEDEQLRLIDVFGAGQLVLEARALTANPEESQRSPWEGGDEPSHTASDNAARIDQSDDAGGGGGQAGDSDPGSSEQRTAVSPVPAPAPAPVLLQCVVWDSSVHALTGMAAGGSIGARVALADLSKFVAPGGRTYSFSCGVGSPAAVVSRTELRARTHARLTLRFIVEFTRSMKRSSHDSQAASPAGQHAREPNYSGLSRATSLPQLPASRSFTHGGYDDPSSRVPPSRRTGFSPVISPGGQHHRHLSQSKDHLPYLSGTGGSTPYISRKRIAPISTQAYEERIATEARAAVTAAVTSLGGGREVLPIEIWRQHEQQTAAAASIQARTRGRNVRRSAGIPLMNRGTLAPLEHTPSCGLVGASSHASVVVQGTGLDAPLLPPLPPRASESNFSLPSVNAGGGARMLAQSEGLWDGHASPWASRAAAAAAATSPPWEPFEAAMARKRHEALAATRIQATIRGNSARLHADALAFLRGDGGSPEAQRREREQRMRLREEEAASSIQAASRGRSVRRSLELGDSALVATVVIQAGVSVEPGPDGDPMVRLRLARPAREAGGGTLQPPENADDEEEAAAAVKLQAMQRGKKARQELAARGEAADADIPEEIVHSGA